MNLKTGIVFIFVLTGFFLNSPIAIGDIYLEEAEMTQFPTIKHSKLISKLVKCESSGRNIKIVDSNGYYSYGILQYQKGTWDWFSKKSGITGDPMNPVDAVYMTNWAIENDLVHNWSCAKKIK